MKEIIQYLKKANECLMIGCLAKSGVYMLNNRSNSRAIIPIKPLCSDPKIAIDAYNYNSSVFDDFTNSGNYLAIDERLDNEFLPNNYFSIYSEEKRIELLNKIYLNKLIIFRPEYNMMNKGGKGENARFFRNANIVNIIDVNIDNIEDNYYIELPVINLKNEIFEKHIIEKQYFKIKEYDCNIQFSPDGIICGDYMYYHPDPTDKYITGWQNHDVSTCFWKIGDNLEVIRIPINCDNSIDYIRCGNDRIIMNLKMFNQLIYHCIYETVSKDLLNVQNNQETLVNEYNKQEIVKNSDINDSDDFQNMFMKRFIELSKRNNLYYRDVDLLNLHICAKTIPLTIIAGMSGTGKTQLALTYAKMLNIDENKNNLLFMPISPSYLEPEDVLGYLNNGNEMYIPANTGLIDILIRAERNPSEMHMVIFDEMNLAQIEYWFAPFISLLEKEVNERNLILYNKNSNCINSDQYPPKVCIKDNIIFIGTINIDETSKMISDRLLDRSFVISLTKQPFVDYKKSMANHKLLESNIFDAGLCTTAEKYNSLKSKTKYLDAFTDQQLEFLDELHQIIRKYDSQKGVSFRILKNIGQYINNMPNNIDNLSFDQSQAFDMVLKQSVIQKLTGGNLKLKELLGEYKQETCSIENSKLLDLFDKYSKISQFTETRKLINQKVDDIETYGYAR